MEAKDKATDLVCDFYEIQSNEYDYGINWEIAKQCSLILVDEILNLNFNIKCDASEKCVNPVMNYWEDVKREIINLNN